MGRAGVIPHSINYRVNPKGRCQPLERPGDRDKSRRQKPKGKRQKEGKASHFRTVRFGGFDETQTVCYLWETVKSIEAVERDLSKTGGEYLGAENFGAKGLKDLGALKRRMHSRIRVEMRRYFLRKKRRDMKMIAGIVFLVTSAIIVFGLLAGIDRVSGNSMYPYLNNGDWILYSRLPGEIKRHEVVVFEKNGESFVKRIAGLPGDTVAVTESGSRVVVNGVQVREPYVTLSDQKEEEVQDGMGTPLTLMDGQYLVLGDNRAVSIDSRDSNIGTVGREAVLGRVVLIVRTGR